jgi:hypothetical protein
VRALDELIELNKQGKLENLTPHQARDLAVDIAARNHLSHDAEYNMQKAFAETVKITREAQKKKSPDGQKVMSYIDKVCETGAETKSPGVAEACKHYMASIKHYIPADLCQDRSKEQLDAMVTNMKALLDNEPRAEPPDTSLGRVFQNAVIDAQSGKKNDNKPAPAQKKPNGPKAA